jgi:hypothetical protein
MLPDIYYFNPTCELAIANGSPFYTAPARLRKFEADLACLPGWLGEGKDQVLVAGEADPAFMERMARNGFSLPAFLRMEEVLADPEWIAKPKGRIFPWGWSPAVCHLFLNTVPSCREEFRQSQVAAWQPAHKLLYSRLTASQLLRSLLKANATPWMPSESVIPVVCDSVAQTWTEIAKHARAVVKTPWSSSGRGLLFFPNVDTRKKNEELLTGMLRQQSFVTVEPWLDKAVDLSYQFFITGGKITCMGRTFFETDRKGRYQRTFLAGHAGLAEKVSDFLDRHSDRVAEMLSDALLQSGYASLYEGWIGVDSMVYHSGDGELKFHPVIEINGRFTMGAIALKMRQHLAAGSDGYLQLYYSKVRNFRTFCLEHEELFPLIMRDGKIVSGFMPLTPPLEEHHSGAWIKVSVSDH